MARLPVVDRAIVLEEVEKPPAGIQRPALVKVQGVADVTEQERWRTKVRQVGVGHGDDNSIRMMNTLFTIHCALMMGVSPCRRVACGIVAGQFFITS